MGISWEKEQKKMINTHRVDVEQECVCPTKKKKNGPDTFRWTVPAQAADAARTSRHIQVMNKGRGC